MLPLYKYLTEDQAHTYGVLLASAGIRFDLLKKWLGWQVWVYEDDVDDAFDLIAEFIEMHQYDYRTAGLTHYAARISWYGVWGALVLLGIHLAIYHTPDSSLFIHSLGASSVHILQGEIFRSATALLIHASHLHLAGNMVGIAIFGSAVCSVTGWGVGWFLITLTGICGNLLNALLHVSGHLSVGASTAVFGAIGILATIQLIEKVRQPGSGLRALMPIGAGLALLAILGSGAHTDIMAHLFGFLSGCALGLCYGIRVRRPPAKGYQLFYLMLTICILIGAWSAAPASVETGNSIPFDRHSGLAPGSRKFVNTGSKEPVLCCDPGSGLTKRVYSTTGLITGGIQGKDIPYCK
jgi:rhomboid protease GluP